MSIDPAKWRLYESALIKSIRRCLPDDAIYWGTRLYLLGRADGVWRRLFIHLSEDIGIADRSLPATIAALKANYDLLKQPSDATAYESDGTDRLPFVHAIMLMATAMKSRAVDNAIVVHFECPVDREIPDYAIDFHSHMARRQGRDIRHFLDEAAHLENQIPASTDLWMEPARKHLLATREITATAALAK